MPKIMPNILPKIMKAEKKTKQTGNILIFEIVVLFIFSLVMLTVLQNAAQQLRVVRTTINREQALQIAEAGINYYQWHLAHFPTDYQDGTGQPGPYVHTYIDTATGSAIGQYSLQITPGGNGSTITTIASTGWTYANSNIRRTIVARYGIPSLAKYAFLTNASVWIGNTESVSGQLMANDGIRFDGTGNAPIQSARLTYRCYAWQGSPCPRLQNGIWGSASQSTQNFWQFPVPSIDFSSFTSNLAGMKSLAQSNGIYLPPSNTYGYSLVFNSDNTVSIYTVTSLRFNPRGWDVNFVAHNEYTDYATRQPVNNSFGTNRWALPANGIIYAEDKVWVEGTVSGRVMLAAAILPYSPATAPTIYIPNNIIYTARDGSATLGLLAQKDIVITYRAPDTLEIDAVLLAQNGSDQFFYYPGNIKTSITIFGSIMSYGIWTWSWVDGSGNTVSGYVNTNSTYDSNLLYSPPPSFPLSSSNSQQISWSSN